MPSLDYTPHDTVLLMQYSPLCAMTKKMGYVSLSRLYEEGVKSESLHSPG